MGGATATRREIRRAFGERALELIEQHDRMLNAVPGIIQSEIGKVREGLQKEIDKLRGELEVQAYHMKVFEQAPWYRRWWWVLTGRR